MTISRTIIKELLSNFAVFVLPFSIVSVIYFMFYGMMEPVLWVLIVPYFLLYAIRKRVNNIVSFLVLHVLVIALAWFVIGDRYSHGFVLVFLVICGLFSLYLKTREEISPERAYSGVLFTLHIGLFILVTSFSQHDPHVVQAQLVVTALAAKVASVIFMHMDNVDYRLRILSKINGYIDPSGKVLAINNLLIGAFAGIMFIVGVGLLFGARVFQAMMALWAAFLVWWGWDDRRYFARREVEAGLQRYEDHMAYLRSTPEAQLYADMTQQMLDDMDLVEHEQEALYEFFVRWFNIFATIILVLFTIYLCRKFYKHFRSKQDAANGEDPAETVIALERNVVGDLLDMLPRFRNKHRHPLRRAYAKVVNKHIKAGVGIDVADTTDVIAEKILATEDISELTAQYEDVRYGGKY